MLITIAAVVTAGVICIYCRKRRSTMLKVPPLECANPANDHIYDELTLNKEFDPQERKHYSTIRPPAVLPRMGPSAINTGQGSSTLPQRQRDYTVDMVARGSTAPEVDLNQPEVQPNVAYGCVLRDTGSSEYALPRVFQQQRRVRLPPPLPGEMQSVEAYAITTL